MLRKWLDKNGSKATLEVLTTAVYSLGPPYWNLLDNIGQHAPQTPHCKHAIAILLILYRKLCLRGLTLNRITQRVHVCIYDSIGT